MMRFDQGPELVTPSGIEVRHGGDKEFQQWLHVGAGSVDTLPPRPPGSAGTWNKVIASTWRRPAARRSASRRQRPYRRPSVGSAAARPMPRGPLATMVTRSGLGRAGAGAFVVDRAAGRPPPRPADDLIEVTATQIAELTGPGPGASATRPC
jgi:hypothetical protein